MTWWQVALIVIGAGAAAYGSAWITLGIIASLAPEEDPMAWIDDLD